MTFLTANLHVGLLIAHSYVAIRACGCIVTVTDTINKHKLKENILLDKLN